MAGVADDAGGFVGGDERAAGFGGVEGEDEVVEALEFGFDFVEFGAEAEGAGFALGDAGLRGAWSRSQHLGFTQPSRAR